MLGQEGFCRPGLASLVTEASPSPAASPELPCTGLSLNQSLWQAGRPWPSVASPGLYGSPPGSSCGQALGEGFPGGHLALGPKGEGTQVRPLACMSPSCPLPSSPQDSRLYLVFPHDSSALSSSFHHLQLFDQDSSNVVSVSIPEPCLAPVGGMGWSCDSPSPWPCPQRFLQDPYSTTFSSFSRVTNFFRGALQPHPEGASPDLPPPPDDEPEPGFEVISCVSIRWTLLSSGCHLGSRL